jgi:Protein of unknown function (DUF2970)
MVNDLKQATQRKASFIDTIKAVGASFFGVRGKAAYEKDVAKLNPVHVVIAGVLMAIVFVLTLITIVRIVLAK